MRQKKIILSKQEREIILNIGDDEKEWTIYSSSPVFIRKLLKIAEKWGISKSQYTKTTYDLRIKLPKKAVSFRGPSINRKPTNGFKRKNESAKEIQ